MHTLTGVIILMSVWTLLWSHIVSPSCHFILYHILQPHGIPVSLVNIILFLRRVSTSIQHKITTHSLTHSRTLSSL